MAKKRGGFAGIWDRNKGIIKTAVPAALSFIPGVGVPLATMASATMEGLDREGKSGIGLDLGQYARGAAKGYGTAQGTQALAGGIKGLLTAGNPARIAAPDFASQPQLMAGTPQGTSRAFTVAPVDSSRVALPSAVTGSTAPSVARPTAAAPFRTAARTGIPSGIPGGAMGASSPVADLNTINRTVGGTPPAPSAADVLSNRPGAFGRFDAVTTPKKTMSDMLKEKANKASGWVEKNKTTAELGLKSLLAQLPSPESRAAELTADIAQQKLDLERKQMEQEQERRMRIAQLLMPFAQDQFPQYYGRR